MSKFNLYVFMDDESATLIECPVLRDVDPNMTELSLEQLREIVRFFYPNDSNCVFKVDEIDGWSREKLGQAMWDGYCLSFSTCAIISETEETKIKLVGEALWKTMGDDSSCYRACEVFATLLKESAVTLVDFPEFDSDKYYDDEE